MDTKELVNSILETVRTEMAEFIDQESEIECPIDYELRVIEIGRKVSRNLILGSQGKLPKSRNSKKK